MIKYRCRVCRAAMESVNEMAGRIEICPQCKDGSLVPFTESVSRAMSDLVQQQPEAFRPIHPMFVLASSTFHVMFSRDFDEAFRQRVKLKQSEQNLIRLPELRLGPGTLFEVRVFFLHRLGRIMSVYHQDETSKTKLLLFCGDMIEAEFKGTLQHVNLGDIIEDRFNEYADCVAGVTSRDSRELIINTETHAFNAPEVSPWTKYFIVKRNNNNRGMQAIEYPAISGP